MPPAEVMMDSASANLAGWVLAASKPALRVPMGGSALMCATVAPTTSFATQSKAVSVGMDLKVTCVTSPSRAPS